MRALPPLLTLMALLVASAALADVSAVVQKPTVDVYAEPRLDAPKVTTLTRGTELTVSAQQGLWYRVQLGDRTGGFVRVNDVRVNYGRVEDSDANMRVLTTGKSGAGRVSETAGVRGIDESELKAAAFNQAQYDAMVANRADPAAAATYASAQGWQATSVAWDAELKPKKDEKAVSAKSGASALSGLGSMLGGLGQKAGSALGIAECTPNLRTS